jgi:hypothetical protein
MLIILCFILIDLANHGKTTNRIIESVIFLYNQFFYYNDIKSKIKLLMLFVKPYNEFF